MQITSVTYRRLKSFGSYEHEALEASARVEPGESPERALQALQDWVCERIDAKVQSADLMERHWRLETQVNALETRLERARERWVSAKALLERHGVELEPELDDVPWERAGAERE